MAAKVILGAHALVRRCQQYLVSPYCFFHMYPDSVLEHSSIAAPCAEVGADCQDMAISALRILTLYFVCRLIKQQAGLFGWCERLSKLSGSLAKQRI
jgi:hypothetical protein